jgi:hypothetical protein
MLIRMHRARAIPLAAAVFAALCLPSVCVTPAQAASDMETCITSHEQSQKLKKDGKLLAARAQLINCARDVCPGVIKKECSQMLTEVDESTPSIVVEAKGTAGEDLVEMKVTMDGEPLLTKLDGRAVNVDPGVHVLKFEIPKAKAREEKIVIREGQKNRKIFVDFSPPKPAGSAGPSGSGDQPAKPLPRPVPALTWVLGGLGIVGLGTSAFFEAQGLSKRSDLDAKGCKPACDAGDVDSAKQSILIGDIAMGVGIASLGVAAIVYFTRPAVKPKKEISWTMDMHNIQGGAIAGFRGSF